MAEDAALKKKVLEEIFDQFDKDKSGQMSAAEVKDAVREFYKTLNQTVEEGQIDADVGGIMAACDTSKDGSIDKAEWFKHFEA